MVRKLPKDVGSQIVARQLARSGTGIGSNVEEAQSAQSRVEFARKMNIALSEAREAHYWLRLAGEAGITKPDLTAAITQEAHELVSILTAVVKRTREGNKKSANRSREK